MELRYRVGSIIVYRPFGGTERSVRVETKEKNIKKGRSGFDGTVVSGPDKGLSVWGYCDQVTDVVSY